MRIMNKEQKHLKNNQTEEFSSNSNDNLLATDNNKVSKNSQKTDSTDDLEQKKSKLLRIFKYIKHIDRANKHYIVPKITFLPFKQFIMLKERRARWKYIARRSIFYQKTNNADYFYWSNIIHNTIDYLFNTVCLLLFIDHMFIISKFLTFGIFDNIFFYIKIPSLVLALFFDFIAKLIKYEYLVYYLRFVYLILFYYCLMRVLHFLVNISSSFLYGYYKNSKK